MDVGLWVPGNFSESIGAGERAIVRVFYVKSEWGDFSYQVVQGFLSAFEDRLRSDMIDRVRRGLRAASGHGLA